MKSISFTMTADIAPDKLEKLDAVAPNFICLFFSPAFVGNKEVFENIHARFPDAELVGCSTAGEISNDLLSDEKISVLAINFEKTALKSVCEEIEKVEDTYQAAQNLANSLKADDLAGIFILSPGLSVNGSKLVQGVYDVVGDGVQVFGGLAGDDTTFNQTYTLYGTQTHECALIGVGFYGDSVEIKISSQGGWKPFGPSRKVTKSTDNLLYEIDNSPALDLYKEYLGDKADGLPASGLLYPFSIVENPLGQEGLVRTILNVDHDAKSLVLAGDMAEGSAICLMHADVDELIEGAAAAAEDVRYDNDNSESAAFLISCVGRKIVMDEDTEEEVDAVREILGDKASLSGFYSYGEIGALSKSQKVELHNQTMTIAHIREA
jgi:hypothetical protein